jgi:hypothetical protein
MNQYRLVITVLLLCAFPNIYAGILTPPSISSLNGVAPFDMGTQLDSITSSYSVLDTQSSYDVVATGTVEHSVWRALDGTVDIYWQVFNDSTSSVAIEALRVSGFGSESVFAEYIDNPGSPNEISPISANRFGGSDFGQGSINFNFGFNGSDVGVDPGQISSLLFIDTLAIDYIRTTADNVSFTSGRSGMFDTSSDPYQSSTLTFGFAPSVSPVPVPAAVWLFGTALIGLIGFGKRRKAA